jgi:hypothetical protein
MSSSANGRTSPRSAAQTSARAAARSTVGHGSGQRIGPSPWAAARASQSASLTSRSAVSPHDVLPTALNSPPAKTGRQVASGTTPPIRSAANHEYGDIAPK